MDANVATKPAPLTEAERMALTDFETIIEEGLTTFVEVGAALGRIRERKLYRASHDTFEAYCQERWGWSSSRARQLIGAHEVVESVTSRNTPAPENEMQARELIAVPTEQRATVLTEAREEAKAEGKKVTAERIRDTAHRYAPPRHRKPAKQSKVDALREQREREYEERRAAEKATEADGGVPTPPVNTGTEASSEVPGGAEPRASSAEGWVLRLDEHGEPDEIIGTGYLHMERLDDEVWWFGFYPAGTGSGCPRLAFTVSRDKCVIIEGEDLFASVEGSDGKPIPEAA